MRRGPPDRGALILASLRARRASSFAVLALAAVLGGCAPARPAAATVAGQAGPAPSGSAARRQPDGVVLEAPPLLPPPASRGAAVGVLTLREPPATDAVVELVMGFLDGWRRESLDSLLAMTSADAGLLDGADHGHGALIESWRQRLHAHDYGRLSGAEIVRPERIEHWEWDVLGTPPNPPRPPGMRPGELLVRAPLEVTRVAGERVFGDVLTMVVESQDGHLRIAAYGETDAP